MSSDEESDVCLEGKFEEKHEGYEKKSQKSKNKKRHKKEKRRHKKHKKRSRSSSSTSSNDSNEEVWVEKVSETPRSKDEGVSDTSKQDECLKRDEWMSLDGLFPCLSETDIKRNKSNLKKKDTDSSLLDKPGQSERELNPYWKNGGTGLPQNDVNKSHIEQTMDARWLKKSLQRAKEQAVSEGRSLEEVAAERWGSLETIQSMIAIAERRSFNDKSYDKWKHHSYKSKYSRSPPRSRNQGHSGRYDRHESSSHFSKSKQSYQKPMDDDNDYDYSRHASHRSNSNHIKNWQKEKAQNKNIVYQPKTPPKENITNMDSTESESKLEGTRVFTEEDMNKLGAKIVKAEIMGDDELARELKEQLEHARKHCVKGSADKDKEEAVILTRTDARGVVRPLESRQSKESSGHHRKKKRAETHAVGERVQYYADDNKYSLQQMFQREKGRSTNEDDAAFAKLASKKTDMDEAFEEQISRKESDSKQENRDRMLAIHEHKRLSKSLDNCRWCIDSKYMIKHMIISMDTKICLSLPPYASLTKGHCVLTPVEHLACQLQLDEDVREKLKTYKKALIKMFSDNDQCPVFFEIYKNRHKFPHMQLECISLPKEIGDSAPMYFKKALLECETEWSVNKKIIDLTNKDVRDAIPKGLAYFAVQFDIQGGYAHVIEDDHAFPKNFAEEIIGGMLDLDYNLWRKQKNESFDRQREKVLEFNQIWKDYKHLVEDN